MPIQNPGDPRPIIARHPPNLDGSNGATAANTHSRLPPAGL